MSNENAFRKVYPHPEWKRMFDVIGTMLREAPEKKFYSYEELKVIAGVDVRSSRGRLQFERFNRECRSILKLHWENVRKEGYRVVEAEEHASYASKRVKKARRQMVRGKHIIDATQIEKLSNDQKKTILLLSSIYNTIVEEFRKQSRSIAKIATSIELPRMIEKRVIDDTINLFRKKPPQENH